MSSWKRKRLEAMGEEDLCDVNLIGTDGEEVPCLKGTMSMISPVFRSMFFKGFREQMADSCRLDYHSVIIRIIVKYCYCGEVEMDLILNKNRPLKEEVAFLVDLRDAGRYFEIEDISSTAEAKIGNLVFQTSSDKKYRYASAFLTELWERGEAGKGPLMTVLLYFVLRNPMKCFGPRGPEDEFTDFVHTNPNALAFVLKDNEDTYVVVRCIQTWFALDSSKSTGKSYSDKDRLALAKIAENTDLKSLTTSQLSNIKPCSLFSSERILDAFVHHCKKHDSIPEAPKAKGLQLILWGAKMDGLNGAYIQVIYKGQKLSIFSNPLKHNGNTCTGLIHRQCGESKWLVSIAKDNWTLLAKGGEVLGVHENCIKKHLYEAPARTEDSTVPPFNGWKCVEGTGPVPLVACTTFNY